MEKENEKDAAAYQWIPSVTCISANHTLPAIDANVRTTRKDAPAEVALYRTQVNVFLNI